MLGAVITVAVSVATSIIVDTSISGTQMIAWIPIGVGFKLGTSGIVIVKSSYVGW